MRHAVPYLALALGAGLLVSGGPLTAAEAPSALGVAADTGVVTLGPNQVMRVTLATKAGGEIISGEFRRSNYAEGECTGGLCSHALLSQSLSGVATVAPGQAVSYEVSDPGPGTRVQVLTSSPRVRVMIEILDGASNNIIAILIG